MRKITLIGIPSDYGANTEGARFAPEKIRELLMPWLDAQGIDFIDYGDIEVPRSKKEATGTTKNLGQLQEICKTFLQVKEVPLNQRFHLILGGDHSIESFVFGEISNQKKLGLLWWDAHGDFNTPSISPSGNVHGMILNDITRGTLHDMLHLHSRLLDERNVVIFGARDLDSEEKKLLDDSEITVITMEEIRRVGFSQSLQRAIEIVSDGTQGYHVSFDVDGCDPSVAPGVSTPVKGGFSRGETLAFMKKIGSDPLLTSSSIVEFNPLRDKDDTTQLFVFELLSELLKNL